MIFVEDLKLEKMTKSAKGTLQQPGKRVKQKANLNRVILDKGLGVFSNLLEYKQLWSGGTLQKVPPQYTSQRCHKCSHTTENNRKSQAVFVCEKCSHRDHADWNAAKNIFRAGLVRQKVAIAA